MKCGTRAKYLHGCSCDLCRAANNAANYVYRRRRRAKGLPPGDSRHGKLSSYTNWMCRCAPCTAAANADYKSRKEGAVT